jgi:hypothetical protein
MEKVRENRLRLAARRQGLALVKSRRRDPRAIGFGCYSLVDRWTTRVVGALPGGGFGLIDASAARGGAERFAAWVSLETVERLLFGGQPGERWEGFTGQNGEADGDCYRFRRSALWVTADIGCADWADSTRAARVRWSTSDPTPVAPASWG